MPYQDWDVQRAYQRTWVAKRRAEWFKDKQCEWCHSTTDLHLHHRDPNRKVGHVIWSWGRARREVELAKCVVLCVGCHRRAHGEARRVEAELRHPCGTVHAYWRGCRCEPCLAARRVYVREHKRAVA